ncbi:MAG: C10 family peptidase [Kiritimatiellae bacterium]|nr:C10 family peptidase [Kiritimatiellia bacterium]
MKSKAILVALLALAFQARAERVSPSEVAGAASAWAGAGIALGVSLGANVVEPAREYAVTNGYSFYAVRLDGGTVIMTSDTTLEPVIAFSSSGELDLSEGSPLFKLLCKDVAARAALAAANSATGVRSPSLSSSSSAAEPASAASSLWSALLRRSPSAATSSAPSPRTSASQKPLSSISDVRVAPLVKSKWSQGSVSGGYCYNYYTPNHYVCGCTATAMSQIMRYFEFPTASVAAHTFKCNVDGADQNLTMQGGVYDWANMTLVPANGGLSEANRKAIGKLTSDAGIALKTDYSDGAANAYITDVPAALRNVFGYSDAICYWNESGWSEGKGGLHTRELRNRVIYTNLDAGQPVQFAIYGYAAGHVGDGNYWAGHAVVADGYGFQTVAGVETEYVHVNMGWAGSDDMWYNIPEINAANSGAHVGDSGYDFLYLGGAVFNISKDDTGLSILSGHVTDEDGAAVAGAKVYAFDAGGACVAETKTSATGIYSFKLPGGARYSVTAMTADGRGVAEVDPGTLRATTGLDGDYVVRDSGKVGNSWGNDMTLDYPSARVGGEVFASLDSAVARAREIAVADPSAPVLIEIIDAARIKKTLTVDFDCVIAATNATPAATPVERIGGAQLLVASGASLVLSNVVFSAASQTMVDVASGSSLGLVGVVDFGVPYDVAAVRTVAASGLRLLGGISGGFTLDCAAAQTANSQFGVVAVATAADFDAVCESAPRIANFYDPYGEQRGMAQGSAPNGVLVWFEQPVPIEDAVGYYVDAAGNTNTAARLDRLAERYAASLAAGELGDSTKMVFLKGGALSRPLPVSSGLAISGGNVSVDLAGAPATVFSVTGGKLSVTGVVFTNFVGNALFFVNGSDASLQLGKGVRLVDIEGTNKWSGAVYVQNGSAKLTGGAVLDNCRASGRFKVSQNPRSSNGGGVYLASGAKLYLTGCTITNCYANGYGGAVYAAKEADVSMSGELWIAGNTSVNSARFVGDDIYLGNPSASQRAALKLTGAVTGAVGVRWSASDATAGNESGLRFATASSAVVAHESSEAFFSDLDAALSAEPVDSPASLAWTAAPTGPQPLPEERKSEASARVIYADGSPIEYYLLVSEALKAINGDATVKISGTNGRSIRSNITISHDVTLVSDTGKGLYWIDRAADRSLIVAAGASLSLRDVVVYGSEVVDDATMALDETPRSAPLFDVRGGSLKLLTPSDTSLYKTRITAVRGDGARNAGAVSVWRGGEFRMASGTLIDDCSNAYSNEADGSGRGGAVLVDDGVAVFTGGKVTDCSAFTGGGVFVGNKGEVKVSGNTRITGNAGLDGKPNDLVVYDQGILRLAGKLTGAIGYIEGVAGDTEVFGKVNSSVSPEDALSSAHKFTHDRTGDIGLAVTGDAGTLLVWAAALAADGTYTDGDGNVYELVEGDAYQIDVPVAVAGLVYNRKAQTGVEEGTGYTLTGNVETDAGSYTAKATLRPGFEWSGGSTATKSISWKISKATYDMSGVTFADATYTYDGSVYTIEISGTLPKGVTVEYANNSHSEVGVYVATATFSGDSKNYKSIPDMTATLTIVGSDPPTPPVPPEAKPVPIAFTAVSVDGAEWTLSVTTAVEKCWYSLYEAVSLDGGFSIDGLEPVERRQATSADVPTMIFTRPNGGTQLFWKVLAEPEKAH